MLRHEDDPRFFAGDLDRGFDRNLDRNLDRGRGWLRGRWVRKALIFRQPSLPPGVYFRMLLVGYFEGINSQRGMAWRCADSVSGGMVEKLITSTGC